MTQLGESNLSFRFNWQKQDLNIANLLLAELEEPAIPDATGRATEQLTAQMKFKEKWYEFFSQWQFPLHRHLNAGVTARFKESVRLHPNSGNTEKLSYSQWAPGVVVNIDTLPQQLLRKSSRASQFKSQFFAEYQTSYAPNSLFKKEFSEEGIATRSKTWKLQLKFSKSWMLPGLKKRGHQLQIESSIGWLQKEVLRAQAFYLGALHPAQTFEPEAGSQGLVAYPANALHGEQLALGKLTWSLPSVLIRKRAGLLQLHDVWFKLFIEAGNVWAHGQNPLTEISKRSQKALLVDVGGSVFLQLGNINYHWGVFALAASPFQSIESDVTASYSTKAGEIRWLVGIGSAP